MFLEERQNKILEIIDKNSRITVEELVRIFSVNAMTVRRDLRILEEKGLLRRVHGGAISGRGRSYEPPFLSRSMEHKTEKEKIGLRAAELINDGDSIAIDVGTTTLEVAKNINQKTNLTIITPSLRVADLLKDMPNFRIIVTGGILRTNELSLVGDISILAINNFFVDKFFLGVGGIDFSAGLTEYNLEDAQIKKALIQRAKDVILVAHASKFNSVAFASVAPLRVVNRIVTDDSIDEQTIQKLNALNIELIIV